MATSCMGPLYWWTKYMYIHQLELCILRSISALIIYMIQRLREIELYPKSFV